METINAIGRRKAAVARVYLSKGSGDVLVNGKTTADFFCAKHLRDISTEPFRVLEMEKDFDVKVNVKGGGIKGQAEAVRLGICRALVKVNEEFKPVFKAKGWMTRDARVVERKKPGLKKARKSDQFSKR
ncbi:MAG: small subunit ribosomal protein S9 [Limisphaerales bacterium]|jgi:small subunit ribosomal protein S9